MKKCGLSFKFSYGWVEQNGSCFQLNNAMKKMGQIWIWQEKMLYLSHCNPFIGLWFQSPQANSINPHDVLAYSSRFLIWVIELAERCVKTHVTGQLRVSFPFWEVSEVLVITVRFWMKLHRRNWFQICPLQKRIAYEVQLESPIASQSKIPWGFWHHSCKWNKVSREYV